MIPPETLLELHNRLLAGDPTAPATIATHVFSSLCRGLQQANGNCSEDLLNQAAGDALFSYFKRPEQFDPGKGTLAAYLRMSAVGVLKNLLRSEKNLGEKFRTGVELSQLAGNREVQAQSLSPQTAEQLRVKLRDLFPGELDWQLAELIIDLERKTEPFAEILGLRHLPLEEQRLEVKRHKDRIKQKLRRFGESIRDEFEPD
jgi:hypothetical protein